MNQKPSRQRPYEPQTRWVSEAKSKNTSRYPNVYTDHRPGPAAGVTRLTDTAVVIRSQTEVQLRIEALSEEVLRFCFAVGEFREAFSYSLAPGFAPTAGLSLQEDPHVYVLETATLRCEVAKADLRWKIFDKASDKPLLSDAAPFYGRSTILTGLDHLRLSLTAEPEEAYLGLGDKTTRLNLRGAYLQNWNTDAFGFGAKTDPLYRSIPFFYGLRQGYAYGIFLHNTWRSHFDFDSYAEGITRIWAEGGEMDFVFIHGPDLNEVASRYHQLTGTPELPPLWALGFHQCRWSYRTENRVRELAADFRRHRIPCDAIYLDIDYMDGYRCFTWDKKHFPNPTALIAELRAQGFRTVSMIDPGIKVDDNYGVYRSGVQHDVFCRRTSGETMTGPVWPPRCVWPDYTRPDVRAWWGQLYDELYLKNGVAGFWNDMNEPAVFKVDGMTFPDEVMHDLDGHPGNHREAHNIYGMQMARATYEGLKKLAPDRRPFVLTRATFSGGQRHAALWTGDNYATWEHLHLANIQCQRAGISGFSFVGTDIGGFADHPTGELLVRWLQLGIFHPLYRIHSMGNNVDGASEADALTILEAEGTNRLDQEPWAFGEPYTSQARSAIELRYRLLPYLYTAFWQMIQRGAPMLRSLVFADQTDPNTLRRENEFLCGLHLLVSPVTKRGVKTQRAYLPAGEWRDYYTGKAYPGRQFVQLMLQPDRIPILVRAGAVIPNFPVMQHTNEFSPDTVDLRVYYGAGQTSEWYLDAGEGYDYQTGAYNLQVFTTEADATRLVVRQRQAHAGFPSEVQVVRIILLGLPFAPQEISIDGQPIQEIEELEQGLAVLAPADFVTVEVKA